MTPNLAGALNPALMDAARYNMILHNPFGNLLDPATLPHIAGAAAGNSGAPSATTYQVSKFFGVRVVAEELGK